MVALRLQRLAKISDPEPSLLRIELTLPFNLLAIPIAGVTWYFTACIRKQENYLKIITYQLAGKLLPTTPLWTQVRQARGCYQFAGQSLSRPYTIKYFYRWKNAWKLLPRTAPDERLEIQFPVTQKFWLRLILDPDHSSRDDEVMLGIPELDSLYVVHASQPEAARNFFSNQPALQDLRRLPFAFDRMEIHKGVGKAEFHFPARRRFSGIHLELAVKALGRLFTEYENRSQLVISIISSQDTRCPYCRGPFGNAQQQTVQCVQCAALIHHECWTENKQCTTWGCRSTETTTANPPNAME
jgi:hypothetical protein